MARTKIRLDLALVEVLAPRGHDLMEAEPRLRNPLRLTGADQLLFAAKIRLYPPLEVKFPSTTRATLTVEKPVDNVEVVATPPSVET